MRRPLSARPAFLAAALFCLASFLSPHAGAATPSEVPIKVTGDSVEYFYDQERAVGKGNIRIEYGGWTLTADEVEVNLKTKEASARGHVMLVQEGAVYKGESVTVNFGTKSAEISNLRAALAPRYFARGKTVRKVGDEYYAITDGYVTTCDDTQCDDRNVPFYRIESREVIYYPDDRIVLKHAVLRMGEVPLFYLPFMVIPVIDIDRFPIEVRAGRSPEWGAFALTRMRYFGSAAFKGNLLFDIRENQGLAGGIEHFYRTSGFGQGAARFYQADDRCGSENPDCSRGGGHTVPETSRYRAQIRHRWQAFEDTGVHAELNKLSDEFVIQDFFNRQEYERISFPDNYLSAIHSRDEYTLSALGRWRFDDFIGVVERTPELRFDTHTQALGDTPFYLRNEVQASKLNLRFKDSEEDHLEANRADMRHRLSYAWKLSPWTVTPYIGHRETYYSRDALGEDRDFVRVNLESGFDASTKFFRVYDTTTNAFGMDLNQLRHIVSPGVHYRYQSKPSHVKESLYPFDATDALDHANFFRFDLENKLQTKSHTDSGALAVRDLFRAIVFTDLKTPAMNRSRLELAGLDVDFHPYRWLTLSSETEYRFETDQFEFANLDVVLNRDTIWVGFGQRYVNSTSNQTTAQVDWKITPEWSVRVYERFEFSTGLTDEFEAVVERRNFFCWTVRFTYNYRNGNNDGSSYFVSFSPTAFSDSIAQSGQTYRRVDPTIPTSGILTSADY